MGILSLTAGLVQGYQAINVGMDLSAQSFEVYTGTIEWKDARGKAAMDSARLIDQSITVSAFGDTYDLADGTYTGEVIYATHSKINVKMDVEPHT